jgi:ribonucleoside-diphosphate reductase alpha subunit
MYVLKRNGHSEKVHFDKITSRMSHLSYSLSHVDVVVVAQKVCARIYPGVSTLQLDELAAEISAQMTTIHPEYGILAGRITVSNLHKQTSKCFTDVINQLGTIIDPDIVGFVLNNADRLNSCIVYDRDFSYSYFAIKTLECGYLLKVNGKIVERPQHMIMRVCCGLWSGHIEKVIENYEMMSNKYFTHASPTLFNAATRFPSLSSCFLLTVQDDTVDGIYNTLKQCANISKHAGGIGLAISNVRASGSAIKSTNGTSEGLVPMLRVFDATSRHINQSSKRKGAFAMYLEPWHADVFEFLELRKPHGIEELRARDLFYGLWIPDLFMTRVESNEDWCLMCPNESPGLQDVYGDQFQELYESYEANGNFKRKLPARQLWRAIIESQQESGTPYMLYKDIANRKSNQKNLGIIKSSNLCVEIIEYSSPTEIASCNLASIALPMFVKSNNSLFDHKKLFDVAYMVTENLNRVIDINYYPVEEARVSNFRHRPIAIGVQGLADVFIRMRFPYESDQAKKLNKEIFETIYFACLSASNDLAKIHGPYSTFIGSPASKGILQFDMWNIDIHSGNWDWETLKTSIMEHGLFNSLLTAAMPTATTSQILGNTESFEPLSNNLYVRKTMAGEFIVLNTMLIEDLVEHGLWNIKMKNKIVANKGSIQGINEIPIFIQNLYKTVWEMKMKTLIDMAADRGVYIDQSQSMNCYMADTNYAKMTSMHFYAFKKGLKTGMYYLRTKPAVNAVQITLDQDEKENQKLICSLKNPDSCMSCSS